MTASVSTQVQLVNRPIGWPTDADFRIVEVEYGDLAPGQARVANEYISVDPYMRGRMTEARSYIAPFLLGKTMLGGAVGRVVESADESLPVGTLVQHEFGWRDVAQERATHFRRVPEIEGVPSSIHLGALGMPSMTAYVGLTAIAGLQPGETVFVSGAAGAVGTAAGQIARLLGAGRVVGSAGTDQKVALLIDKYGYDAAFNYADRPVRKSLADAAPDGIDVFFDNVGGEHLEAALSAFKDRGRAALCGAIVGYNATERTPGPSNLANVISRGLTLKGFTVPSYMHLAPEFNARISEWFSTGQIEWDETVVDGIENSVQAFIDMMHGANIGKMVVRVG